MNGFPRGIVIALAAIALIAGCATTESRWEAARAADTISAYEDFLAEHPEGEAADQARLRRDELRARDAEARATAISRPGGEALPPGGAGKFLRPDRGGIFLDQARREEEGLSHERAVSGGMPPAYADLPERYPAGRPADEVRSGGEGHPGEEAHAGVVSSVAETPNQRGKPAAVRPAPGWGTIMHAVRTVNIRAKRSPASRLKGQLKGGQAVRVDFLQDGWYAVFPVDQKRRNEKRALGYVLAALLRPGPGADRAETKPAPALLPPAPETRGPAIGVKSITFKPARDGKEMVFIEFDSFFTPAISGVEGSEPRIVLSIANASPLRPEHAAIDTGGTFIRRIRAVRDERTGQARIVLDMVPERSYFVGQAFYRKGNVYSLEVSEQAATGGP